MCDSVSESGCGPPDDVCRDFMRNVCNRGKKCRFKHPTQNVNCCANARLSPQEERINFCKNICHDFQNADCHREECKFLHCSKDDQELLMETGSLSSHLMQEAIVKAVIPFLQGEAPVCRDYLSGECRRGKSCRFRHLSHCKYKKELDVVFGVEQQSTSEMFHNSSYSDAKRIKTLCSPCNPHHKDKPCGQTLSQPFSQTYVGHDSCNGRVFVPERYSAGHHSYGSCQMGPPVPFSPECCDRQQDTHGPHMSRHATELHDENSILKKQVFELRRQVADLMTANEFLLEQNANLRMIRKNGATMMTLPGNSATLNVQPAPGQQLVASAVPVSIAPVTGPGPGQMALSTMAMTGQGSAQQLVPVSCHAPGQQIMAAVNTVTVAGQTGSPALLAAAVPVSSSQLVPVSAVPVSLATVSMAPVHMPPIVTAASEPPHSIAMSVSAATSLVSYPIMTQTLLQTR